MLVLMDVEMESVPTECTKCVLRSTDEQAYRDYCVVTNTYSLRGEKNDDCPIVARVSGWNKAQFIEAEKAVGLSICPKSPVLFGEDYK